MSMYCAMRAGSRDVIEPRIDNLSMSLPTKCRDRSFGQVPRKLSAVAVVENEVMELLSSLSSLPRCASECDSIM